MKKLLGIIVLGLLLSGNSFANTIVIPVTVNVINMDKGKFKLTYSDKIKQIIKKDFEYVNNIWKKAGVLWEIKKIRSIKAKVPNNFNKEVKWLEKNYITGTTNKEKIKRRIKLYKKVINFNKYQNLRTINLYFLPEMFVPRICGATLHHSSDKTYKPVIVGFKDCIITGTRAHALAHEFGHVFELKHRGTKGKDLMIVGGGTNISEAEIIQLKQFYNNHLKHF